MTRIARLLPVDWSADGHDQGSLPVNPSMLDEAGVDEHLIAQRAEDQVAGCCSLWYRNTPALNRQSVGMIGHYAAETEEAAAALLDHACRRLRDAGVTMAAGPIDGSTWRSYRLITERGTRPPFFLEPDHPEGWVGHFENAGFSPVAHYVSAEAPDLTVRQAKLERLERRLAEQGVAIRSIDLSFFEEELIRIHELSMPAFARNLLYTPIDCDTFLDLYRPMRKHIVPELVLLAEREDVLLGYVFGVPDLLQASRGEPVDTVIVKTLAVRPGRQTAGLGGLLMERCHLAAHGLGFKRAIHALMHESNKSLSLSAHYGRPFRRYALFGKRVGP